MTLMFLWRHDRVGKNLTRTDSKENGRGGSEDTAFTSFSRDFIIEIRREMGPLSWKRVWD